MVATDRTTVAATIAMTAHSGKCAAAVVAGASGGADGGGTGGPGGTWIVGIIGSSFGCLGGRLCGRCVAFACTDTAARAEWNCLEIRLEPRLGIAVDLVAGWWWNRRKPLARAAEGR